MPAQSHKTDIRADFMPKLARMGISELNAIQRAVVATDARTRRMLLLSPTGSGKTVAYALALLRTMTPAVPGRTPTALILAPSRELAQQIFEVIRPLSAPQYKTVVLCGGRSVDSEIPSLTSATPPDIVVATPGRLLDHISRGTVVARNISRVIIDEYDKLLALGFERQVGDIMRRIGTQIRLLVLTSATEPPTLPPFITDCGEPLTVKADSAAAAERQGHLLVMGVSSPERDKLDTLATLLRELLAADRTAMVFVNHRDAAVRVVDGLRRRGITAVLYHGGLEQREREIAVAAFASHAANVMVSTDLGARGLDIPQVGAVIHYHLPVDAAAYTHRNGRTARAGADGEAYVILGPDEDTPEYIDIDRRHYPSAPDDARQSHPYILMYIDAGRRRKISRGDILGFATKDAGIPGDRVGHITIAPEYALVAVAPEYADALRQSARAHKLKGQKVRITPV